MSSRSRLAGTLAVAAACLVVLQDSAIHAQVRQFPQPGNLRQQGQRNLPQLDLQGTVDAVAVGALKVTSDTKQTWLLRVSGETRVEVKGKASADLLGPGTYIAFTAEVNKKGARIEEKVKEVAIFTPSNRMQVGAVPEGAGLAGGMAGLNVGDDQPFGGGAGAGGKAGGKGKAASKAKSSGKASAAKTSETYEIKGQITSIKGSKVTLKVPNEHFKSSLRFDLAEDVEVSLDIEGPLANCGPLPSLVKQGDRVEIKGVQVAENGGTVSDLKVNLGGTEAAGEDTPKKGKAGAAKDGKDAKDAKGRGKAAAKEDTKDEDDGAKKKGEAKKKAKDE